MRGAATAELAVALPILVALTVVLTWFLSLGLAQVRTVDAAREAARSIARGDSPEAAVAVAQRIAPQPSVVSITAGDLIVVQVSARVSGPGRVFHLAGVTVHARAATRDED